MPPVAFLSEMEDETGFVAPDLRGQGSELAEAYRSAKPFPHIVIDDFLPSAVLDQCLKEFPSDLGLGGVQFDRDQERLKSQFNPDTLAPTARTLFYSFNSRPFIRLLENVTGIKGLIPDPYFLGAGFHEIAQGGHLSVHVDFNHHKLMNLERRINVLIYLNKDWKNEYGGQLELWTADMSACSESIVPLFNRCVIFNTTENSYHGNPNFVNHPELISRKSIALYYYTSTWSNMQREHTTQFKVRRGSSDRPDVATKANELVSDLLPPILLRNLRQMKRRGIRQ